MAFLFRRKLVCFYCGLKSAQLRTPDLRRWQCTHCEAENYLDEVCLFTYPSYEFLTDTTLQNGEITDPPADDVSSNAHYAQSLARPSPPVFGAPDDSLFCSICLKNQHLVSQALASYLPPPDAPDYAEYVKAENEYLKGLEERYPQVCKKCEPRVQERIRAAGYAAKTDHLRRMMDRTRGHGIQYRNASWGSPLVTLGGVGWFLSLAGQVLWDGLSLFESTKERHGLQDLKDSLDPVSGSMCLQQVMRGSGSIFDCTELLYSAVGLALLLGVLSSWWNPVLQETLRRKGGRAVGTTEFYRLQGMLLIIRFVTWRYLPGSGLTVQMTKAAHLSLLVLAAIVSVRFADVGFEADTFPDDFHVFSLPSDGLLGSSQISRESQALGTSDDPAGSVRCSDRVSWFYSPKAESIQCSHRWWYTTNFYYGFRTAKPEATTTIVPTTYPSTR